MENLRIYFNKFLKLNDSEWKDFENCLANVNITNKEQILRPNVTFTKEYIKKYQSKSFIKIPEVSE